MTEHSYTDVLIIGAGPSGLLAAMWLTTLGIKVRVIERRANEDRIGQADGLHARSMEMFESFGFDRDISDLWEPITDDAYWWRDKDGVFSRKERSTKPLPVKSRWTGGLLMQGTIESIMIKHIRKRAPEFAVEYSRQPESLDVAQSSDERSKGEAYPVTVTVKATLDEVEHSTSNGEAVEAIRAKYLIGADGGKSWTRKALGFTMQGSPTNSVWGVIDLNATSNFPDFRTATVIQSENEGGCFFFRRERGMIRIYVQLNKGPERQGVTKESVTQEFIVQTCQSMLRPYELNVKRCEWWTVYKVAQHLSSDMSHLNRVFLVGDAVHTHSPLIGQGMNISMQDSYNLAWKIGGVLRGSLNPRILDTYVTERRPVAKQLVEADQVYLTLFDAIKGQEPPELLERATQLEAFLMGLSTAYSTSVSVAENDDAVSADQFTVGMRVPEVVVTNHATAKPSSVQTLLPSDGTWHLLVLVGDVAQGDGLQRLNQTGEDIKRLRQHFEEQCRRTRGQLFHVLAFHTASRSAVELDAFHETFFPADEEYGYDYDRLFIMDEESSKQLGIHGAAGRVVLVRPDQYVAWVGELESINALSEFCSNVFVA